MITDGFSYLAAILAVCGLLMWWEQRSQWRLFTVLPAIVLLYFVVMLLSTAGLWETNDAINQTYRSVKNNLLPAMIFLMLLKADLRQIRQLGGKMLMAFLCASLSIGAGFVLTVWLFSSQLPADAWKTFAALCGSWMGGTGNMAAIQLALDVPDHSMGYTLLIDSIDYALWVMFLLALVPLAPAFARWTGADQSVIERVGESIKSEQSTSDMSSTMSLLLLVSVSFGVSAIAQTVAGYLPVGDYFTATAWTVTLVTLAGIAAAMGPMARWFGSVELSTLFLYVIIGLIASRADFAELTQAPLYIVMGLVILLIHGLAMVGFARLFKFDLFTCGIASLANIGGVASAPILAAAYSRALIPIGVLMALLGYIVGTAGGLLVGKILNVVV